MDTCRNSAKRKDVLSLLAVVGVLWAILIASDVYAVYVGNPRAFTVLATAEVAVAAVYVWRTQSIQTGTWKSTFRSWWLIWLIVIVGSIATGSDGGGALQALEATGTWPAATLIMGCIVAPIAEETLFRGFVLRKIYLIDTTKFRPVSSVAVSAIVFGLTHGANIVVDGSMGQTVMVVSSAIAFGVLIGIGYVRSWNLYGAIAAHIIGNVLTF